MTDLHWLGVAEIGAGYAAGTLTPTALVEALLARIAAVGPELDAFIRLDADAARADAARATAEIADGGMRSPLHGVPVAIKDVIDVAGVPTTCHSRLRLNHVAAADAEVVARLRAAGAIVFGKLATHEFAIGGPAFDLPFRPARNPWNRDHHPGGSSSGAGAAVAAGLVPCAVGTDTAGSIRNPASACGIVGVKPTIGLVPVAGVFPLAWSLDHVGPLARSVGDAALLLAAMATPVGQDRHPREGGDPYAQSSVVMGPRLRGDDGTESGDDGRERGDLTPLRVGIVRHFHETDLPAGAETVAAFEAVAAALAAAGAECTPVTLPSLVEFAAVNRMILAAEGFAIHAADLRERPELYAAITRRTLLAGAFITAEDYLAAQRRRVELTAATDAVFEAVDVLLTASSMEPSCRIDDPAAIAATYLKQARTPFNLTGHPALGMMSGLSTGGLPLSVQFVARRGEEAAMFRAAGMWERVLGVQRPPI